MTGADLTEPQRRLLLFFARQGRRWFALEELTGIKLLTPGDVDMLPSLVRRGLIQKQTGPEAYLVTSAGIALAAKLRG